MTLEETRARAIAMLDQPVIRAEWVLSHDDVNFFCIQVTAPRTQWPQPHWHSETEDELKSWAQLLKWLEDDLWNQSLNL